MSVFGMLAVACSLTASDVAADSRVARLAIIGAGAPELKCLLVAGLSSAQGITLVEREELERLVDEKRLSALMAEGKFATLGALLSADGLLVVDTFALPDGKREVTVRLVSVRNGACLVFAPVARDLSPQEWVEGFTRLVTRAAPMARIARQDALPVSLLNLRASVFTPESAMLEKALSRLLELRLGSMPGVVLLDRRKLGDADFERSLQASDLPPLWEAAVLVDGGLEVSGESVRVNLRLRQQDGSPINTSVVEGETDGLGKLADALAAAVLAKTGRAVTEPLAKRELEEFFHEAVWAWRSGLFDAAEEALAAAKALGDKSPDTTALATWLLTEQAAPKGIFYGGKYLRREPPSAPEKVALLEQAFASLAEYQESGGKLNRIQGGGAGNLGAGTLKHQLIERASEFLSLNDNQEKPVDVSSLRKHVREAAGMEAGGTRMPYSLAMSSRHARDWAEESSDLMAFYEKLLRSDHKWLSSLLKYFLFHAEAALGPRFCKNPAALASWADMWQRLLKDPDMRLRALFVLSKDAKTDEQDAMYREFLLELGQQGKSLFEKNQVYAFLEPDSEGLSFHERFQAERTELFLTLCRTLPGYNEGLSTLIGSLKIPPGREQEVWNAYGEYRARCLAGETDPRKASQLEISFTRWSGVLMRNNPGISAKEAAGSLVVRRFWHPYCSPEWKGKRFDFNEAAAAGRSIWIFGVGGEGNEVHEVTLPSLQARTHALKCEGRAFTFSVCPDAIWVLTGEYPGNDQPMRTRLVQWKREDGASREYSVPAGVRFNVVGKRVFLRLEQQGNNGGLIEVDPQTGEFHVLVSARRKPPQSPFDDAAEFSSAGVIVGPGGKICVAVREPRAGLVEAGGDWKKVVDFAYADILHYESRSLLVNARGAATLVDPSHAEPECWLAEPQSPKSARQSALWTMLPGESNIAGGASAFQNIELFAAQNDGAGLPKPESWLAGAQGPESVRPPALWTMPPGEANLADGASAFRSDELFAVRRNQTGAHSIRWWFKGGPREGVEIPLRFELGADVLSQLEPLRKALAGGFVDLDGLKDPNRVFYPLRILATVEGIVLHHRAHGFWFIPNADLVAWREGNRK